MNGGKSYNPSTATLEEATEVVRLIREKLTWANGEYAGELHDDLVTWERVVRERGEELAAMCPSCGGPVCYPGHPTHALAGGRYSCEAELSEAEQEADAWAIEEDRRFEQYRDDEITARHTGGHDG